MFWDEWKGSGCSVAGWRRLWLGQWEQGVQRPQSAAHVVFFLNTKAGLNESIVIHVAKLCKFLIMPVGLFF